MPAAVGTNLATVALDTVMTALPGPEQHDEEGHDR
jgi:hypothetical protein